MNTINTPTEQDTRMGTDTWDESLEDTQVEDSFTHSSHEGQGTHSNLPGTLGREENSESFGHPEPMGAPVPSNREETVTTTGDPTNMEHSDEVLRIVHNAGEEKPWEIQYGDGINLFQKARAILNYPVHKFETEAKAQEVAEMLRGIIDADAVEQDGRIITREGVDDRGEFFHTVSEKGEAPPGTIEDSR